MKKPCIAIIVTLLLAFSGSSVLAQEGGKTPPEPAAKAKADDRLPIHKEGWQFFLAPYLWIPGVHLDISHQGRFSGTIVADIP